tara:strand:- start:1740 stop:1964 length:225 start_codon:yes stop_codon:yes gene_type:complete
MYKKLLTSTFFLLIFLITIIPSTLATSKAIVDCRVDVLIWKVNGDCKGTVTCGDDQYWIDCCSDFGSDVGWCEN